MAKTACSPATVSLETAMRTINPLAAFSTAIRKSPHTQDCVVGPGEVPRTSKSNNLDCQTILTAPMGAKDNFLNCKTRKS
jgi:hypothetical protein